MSHKSPTPPEHLSTPTKKWWRQIVAEFDLEDHHLRILRLACEAWDRGQMAREAIETAGGLSYLDRFGAPKLRPEVNVERDARVSFARLVREIGLDAAGSPETPRPPSLKR